MPADAPVVTVVIPVFNSAATLRRALASVQEQTLAQWEVIVIDDASTDDSAAVADAFAVNDARIAVQHLPRNGGKPHAMNLAAARARGRWLAVLDADDRYLPDRLRRLVEEGEARGVEMVADNQWFYDGGADRMIRTAFPPERGGRVVGKSDFIRAANPYADFDFGLLKPLVRLDFIRRFGLRYRENTRFSEDFYYLLDFFVAGGRAFLAGDPLYVWTQPFGSISRRWTETGAGAWRYDYLGALSANADALALMRARGETGLARMLERRGRAFQVLHCLSEFSRLRTAGAGLVPMAGLLARHPATWPVLMRRAARRVCGLIPAGPGRGGGADSALLPGAGRPL